MRIDHPRTSHTIKSSFQQVRLANTTLLKDNASPSGSAISSNDEANVIYSLPTPIAHYMTGAYLCTRCVPHGCRFQSTIFSRGALPFSFFFKSIALPSVSLATLHAAHCATRDTLITTTDPLTSFDFLPANDYI